MASRVNKRFLIILASVVVVVAGSVAALGAYMLQNRPYQFMSKGDAFAAQGNWAEASKNYERAVGHDRTNVEWLNKWINALKQTTPEKRADYEEQYRFYRNVLRQLSTLQSRNPEAVLAYVTEVDRSLRVLAPSREELESSIEEFTRHSEDLDAEDPVSKRILGLRGLAQVDRMAMVSVSDEERAQALVDLESAAAAEPKNADARLGVLRWHLAEVDRLRKDLRPQTEVDPVLNKAKEMSSALVKEFPYDPFILTTDFQIRQSERLRTATTLEARRELAQTLRAEAIELINTLVAAPADTYRPEAIERLLGVTIAAGGQEAVEPLLAWVDRGLAANPSDSRLLLARGQLLLEAGRTAEALTTYQRVIDLPNVPVSIEGLVLPSRRMSAMAFQVDAALADWSRATDDASREKALAAAEKYRDVLKAEAGVRGDMLVLLRDAKIAFAQRKYDETVAKLSEFRSRSAQPDAQVLQILAQALEQQGISGEAIKVLEELRAMAPGLAWTHQRMGDIYVRDNRLALAANSYRAALALDPSNEDVKQRLASVLSATGGEIPEEMQGKSDPIITAIYDARRLRQEGKPEEARKKIEGMLEQSGDNRLLREAVQIDLAEGKRDAALARVVKALEKTPDDMMLKQMRVSLESSDPVEGAINMIAASDATPLQKELALFNVLVNANRGQEARKHLDAAAAIAPNDPAVIDLQFVLALGNQDFAKAQELVQRAATLNIDQVGGMLYQGRLELVEGDTRPDKRAAAVSTFESVVKRQPFNPVARRLLGQALQKAGRVGEALEAFKLAYEGDPADVAAIRDYVSALIALNRGPEALAVLNPPDGALSRVNDAGLQRLWIDLQSQHGNREAALRVRESMFKQNPNDIENAAAYARALASLKRFDEAEAVYAQLEKNPAVDPIALARARASDDAAQGNLDAGVARLRDAIKPDMSVPDKLRAKLTLSGFLLEQGREEDAAAVMREAREFQNPERQEADRALGDFHFNRSMTLNPLAGAVASGLDAPEIAPEDQDKARAELGLAIEAYERVVQSVTDADVRGVVQRRLAEAYLRMRDYPKARALVDRLAEGSPEEMQLMLLRASVAAAEGDRRLARQLYDRAVSLNPGNPNPFLQRAIFNQNVSDPEALRAALPDILQDYEQVCRLRPTMIGAWLQRFELLKRFERLEEGFGVMRAAIAANPSETALRIRLMRELVQAGRSDEMQQEIARAVEADKNNKDLLTLAARVFASLNPPRWRDAARYYEQYFTLEPTPQNAGVLLDALLRPDNSPTRARVQELLQSWEPVAGNNVADLMLRARARLFTSQREVAEQHMLAAMNLTKGPEGKLVDGKFAPGRVAADFMGWLIVANAKQGDPGAGVGEAMQWIVDRARVDNQIHPYFRVQLLIFRSLRPDANAAALIAEAESLLNEIAPDDDLTRFELLKGLSRIHYAINEFDRAAVRMADALKINENDVELNNNLAYTMVTHLDKPREALTYGIRAAERQPDSPTILDTLGWAYFKMGDYPKAVETLTKAAQFATRADDLFIAMVHLGHAQLKAGDRAGATESLRRAQEVADRPTDKPQAASQPDYVRLLETLRKDLE